MSQEQAPQSGGQELYPATAVMPVCKRLFGFLPEEDDLLETVLEVIDKTGNIGETDLIAWSVPIEDHHSTTTFPAGSIKTVSLGQSIVPGGPPPSALLSIGHIRRENEYLSENTLVGSPASVAIELDALLHQFVFDPRGPQPAGPWVDFVVQGEGCIMTPSMRNGLVDVCYRSYRTCEDGLPLISKEVVKAVVYELNFNRVQMRYYMGEVPKNMFDTAQQAKERAIGQARRAGGLTDQGMSKILDAMTSWGRHRYGRSFRTGV